MVHVHVTEGQRVSYRPYLAASAALHQLLASREMAEAVHAAIGAAAAGVAAGAPNDVEATAAAPVAAAAASAPSTGVVVEKASIDEAYVQLPAGSVLATAAPAAAAAVRDLVKRRLDIVLSVGAARNKLLAKLASVRVHPYTPGKSELNAFPAGSRAFFFPPIIFSTSLVYAH